ncbi:MAG: hypothetical protein RI894_725 [Bacteroidota bacterium]
MVAIALLLASATATFAQVMLPYTQDFETATFVTGGGQGMPGVQFLPGWYGNQVQPTPASWRIHRDTIYPNSTGRVCLAALPTATVRDTIILSMTVPANNQALISFYTASDSAHTAPNGTRSAKVNYDFSFDGGFGYTQQMPIGDTAGYPRRPTPYIQTTILAPYSVTTVGTNYSLKFRMIVSRGYGVGTAARFLFDDLDVSLIPLSLTENRTVKTNSLLIAPNPASDIISFQLRDASVKNATLLITDIAGRTVYTKNNLDLDQNQRVALPNLLDSGIYTLLIQTENSIYTQKLVVEK